MTSQWPVEIDPDLPVASTPERVVAVKIPAAISARLDSLVQKVEVLDELDGVKMVRRGTSRKELIAALILDASAQRSDLNRVLLKYRRARVNRTLLPNPKGTKPVVLRGHSPGPRPTSGGAKP
jgi:hypothetical protein